MNGSEQIWMVVAWVTWFAGLLWALAARRPSLAFVALWAWILLNIVLPAHLAVRAGRTVIGPYDFTAGTAAALRLVVLAQVSLLAATACARTLRPAPRPARVRMRLPARRLDRWSLVLLLGGASSLGAFVLLAGADPGNLNVLWGTSRYGDLLASAEGPVLKYLRVLSSLAGVAMIAATLRITLAVGARSRATPALVLGAGSMLLVMGGGRSSLLVPVVACGLVWWRTTPGRSTWRPRRWLLAGAVALFGLAALVGGLRGQGGEVAKAVDPVEFARKEARSGVFATTAGLVEAVPERTPHLWGRSYADIVVLPVPRALWEEKPDSSIEELQRSFVRRDIGASFAFAGELYANFGLVGVMAGCFGFGLLLERIWLELASSRRLERVVWSAALVPVLIQLFSRGWLAGQLAGQVGFLVGVWWLASRLGAGSRRCLRRSRPPEGPSLGAATAAEAAPGLP